MHTLLMTLLDNWLKSATRLAMVSDGSADQMREEYLLLIAHEQGNHLCSGKRLGYRASLWAGL